MRNYLPKFLVLLAILGAFCLPVFGQGTGVTGSISGAVTDQTGAVIADATVVVKNKENGLENTVTTSDNGTFTVATLGTGIYTVTITHSGFKQAVVTDVKVNVGTPTAVNVVLEVGAQTETVTVVGSSAELMQTQSATVGTTITGRQITDLPFASRNALDLIINLPGTSTVGRPRTSSVNGLPKNAVNITLDGVNVQDPLLKNNDGFFTYIQPKTDAIQEVTMSTATPGAESSGQGAVQIKFATRQGSPEFHGSAYIYHRNSFFNSNYWFNNRDLPEDPVDHKAPRNRVLLTQPGVRVGGPILIPYLLKDKSKAFFFVNYEEFRLPESVTRQRIVFAPSVLTGSFSWIRTSTTANALCTQINATQQQCTQNLLTLAGASGFTSTKDPIVGPLLDAINASTGKGGLKAISGQPNINQFSFINTGFQKRQFPTVNLTWNITKNHQLTNVYNYQIFRTAVDFLNNADPRFPGFPNHGAQNSNRFSDSATLVSKLGSNISNEMRFALVGGTVVFFPEVSASQFVNQGGNTLGITNGLAAPNTLTTPTATANIQRRNGPVQTFSDTATWAKGNHAYTFGGDFTRTNLFIKFIPGGNFLRPVTFGIEQTVLGGDPVNAIFSGTNFPGASATQLGEARAIYATLVGRVTAVGGNATADEKAAYTLQGNLTERAGQKATGVFFQDAWRFRPNITVNLGLRYEVQGPYYAKNNAYTVPLSFNNIFGCSGPNNFFHPDGCTNPITQFQRLAPGSKAYNTDLNNFAPTFGLAYSPDFKKGILHRLFGNSGQSALRVGYSIAYVNDGTNVGSTGLDVNPGQAFSVARNTGNDTAANGSACNTCLPIGTLLRNGLPGAVFDPAGPAFPFTPGTADQGIAFSPNLRTGYTQSWQVGIQREIMKDTVIEARYVGNRAHKLTRLFFINEVNTVENGFSKEFALAQANLIANNIAGGARAGSFAFFGAGTGTSPLPIFLAYLNAQPFANAGNAGLYTSTNFKSTVITNNLTGVAPSPTGVAGTLSGSAGLRANALLAGLQRNFFVVNPDVPNGVFLVDNGAMSSYDSLQIEVRRRLSAGLLVQANYVFAKSLTDLQASSSIAQSNYTTLRNPRLNKALSPFDITQSFKGDFIYELPVGKGKWLFGGVGNKMNWLVGGWGINGTFRIQSGSPFDLGNVQLVNMTQKQLQSMIKIRKESTAVLFLPQSVIDNTIKAFNVNPANATSLTTGYSSLGAPDPSAQFIAPAGFGNCQFAFNGQCGSSRVILKGPRFTRFDLSLAKKVTFSESKNLEFRTEFLNAFNNINFKVGSFANDVTSLSGTLGQTTFGQTTVAYQDTSTTTDPGGRLVQFVLRFNF
jgi:hypothetical protein